MFDPNQENPTTPYGYRPMVGPGPTGATPKPYAAPGPAPPAPPPTGPPPGGQGGPVGGGNPFDDVLERVEADWSATMDDGANQQPAQPPGAGLPSGTRAPQAPGAPVATPFADHVLTRSQVGRWRDLVDQVGQRLGVPGDVGLALVQAVSGGRPDYRAAGGRAVGLAGVPVGAAPGVDLHDPTANLTTALAHLRSAHDRLGDWDRAALAATGFGDASGSPRVLHGPSGQVDGFDFLEKFKSARREHAGPGEE